jgi:hypothetical protein
MPHTVRFLASAETLPYHSRLGLRLRCVKCEPKMARAYAGWATRPPQNLRAAERSARAMKASLAAAKKRTADLARERKRFNLAIPAELR